MRSPTPQTPNRCVHRRNASHTANTSWVVSSATDEPALPGVRPKWQGEGASLGQVSLQSEPRAELGRPPASLKLSLVRLAQPLAVDDLNHVRVDLSSSWIQAFNAPDKPGPLTLHDASYPGWNAYVDGLAAPITAEPTARAVSVTRGTRTVDFVYAPASVTAGLFISLLSLMALTALGTSRLRRCTS